VEFLQVVEGESLSVNGVLEIIRHARFVLEAFRLSQRDSATFQIPEESQKDHQGGEKFAAFGRMPRNVEGNDECEQGVAIETVLMRAFVERAVGVGESERGKIVLIALDVRILRRLCVPNVDDRAANLPRVTARWACTERVAVVEEEFSVELDDQERFVIG
jgi:hypothetical protein